MLSSATLTAVDAAEALAWLVAAGADTAVDDAPRNWLAAPVAAAPAVVHAAATAPAASVPGVAARLAAAAEDLAALHVAVAAFDHPLRTPAPPQLIGGALASGVIIAADLPDDDPAVLRLTARMLAAIGLGDDSSARLHLLPWAPPAGRPPRDPEIAAFAPFVARAITLATPRAILAFGERAAALSGEARGIASARGKWLEVAGVPLLATFHPRLLLKQPDLKRLAWADLQAFAERLAA